MHTLSIVIPAYNEEHAIASIIDRCLKESPQIIQKAGLESIEIIVVNDGSTDQTAKIVLQYDSVKLISHGRNLGYGAALKTGFAQATGDIIGFLDGDGTCDPKYFGEMCQMLKERNADIILGSRMHSQSKMPRVRKLGNRIYAFLITLISGTLVTDSASGMRVIKKESLKKLYPLPDGLHFTPAMTCKAVFDESLSIYELPMSYAERRGRSKLNLIKDGFRFLQVIFDLALTYKPGKLFGTTGVFLILFALTYGVYLTKYKLENQGPEEEMIYQLVIAMIFLTVGLNLVCVGKIAEGFLFLMGYRIQKYTPSGEVRWGIFSGRNLLIFGAISVLLGLGISYPIMYQYLSNYPITIHWSYAFTGGTLVLIGFQLIMLGVLYKFIELLGSYRNRATIVDEMNHIE